MEFRYLIILQVSAACVLGLTASQCKPESSSKGLHFMMGIMAPHGDTVIHILLTTDLTASIRLIIPYINMDKHYTFTYHTDIPLPGNITHMINGTDRKGFEIISDVPVSVTVLTGGRYGDNLEGYLALPTDALSTKYIVASYTPYGSYNSEFLLVGVEDLSNITIELPQNYQNQGHYSIPINVQLNKYESYQFQGPYDVSGTIISSDAPVVVMAGSEASKIPVGYGDDQYMVEQMIPTDYWDFKYIVPSIYPRLGYTIKIFATAENTNVTYSDGTKSHSAILNEHTHKTVQFGKDPVIVTADKPINIVQYGMDAILDRSYGDPFMINVQAISQFQSKYVFRTQPLYGNIYDTLAITVKRADLPGLLYDGSHSAIQSATKIRVHYPLSEYMTIYFNIAYKSHHVLQQSNNRPFGAVIYGLPGRSQAYGYPLSLMFTNNECNASVLHEYTTSQPSTGQMTTTSQSSNDRMTTTDQGHQTNNNHTDGNTRCFSCNDMTHLKYCDRVITCGSGDDVCYVQSYATNSGQKYYKSGCMSRNICYLNEHQGSPNYPQCTHCCNGSFCNTNGCGDNGIPDVGHRGPLCYDCKYLGEHDICHKVQLCLKHQVCHVEKFRWGDNDSEYSIGCSDTLCSAATGTSQQKANLAKKRSAPVCSHCCKTDFCNLNCTVDFGPSFIG